ncbi:hypothetical protein [Acinetobacter sp. CFCC 10889]|uniref:hypothetical protein n=1 Tax=Acinetobacter sp. CFCC 10889 TaxID=1775557 RepID=UPI000DCF9F09|nr:hypothetical protein [Acinetobacter sp. CFCC 10889]
MIRHDLIEQVGGIEKAKAIVEGAPAFPVIGYCILTGSYIFKRHLANCYYHNETNSWSEEYAVEFVSLKDLRTAITQHYQDFERFLADNDIPIRKSQDGYLFSNRLVYDAWAKSAELGLKKIHDLKSTKIYLQGGIKQLESDDVRDIRNHISPNMRVVEL